MDKYDYIIVGAGLAGGILARKLTENNKKKGTLIQTPSQRSYIS